MTYEGLRLRILEFKRKFFANYRKKQLKITDFTIISNNCWGGMVYESYNLPKGSPTVGLFFMAEDYIKFLQNIKEYLSAEMNFINPNQSRWKEQVCADERFGDYPVGILKLSSEDGTKEESIEVFFLHYHSEQEAKEKWERRAKRVNWKHLLVKFNDQNSCTKDHIKVFNSLPYEHKVCFTVKDYPEYQSVVKVKAPKCHEFIRASYEPFGKNKNYNVDALLNSLAE